MRKVRLLGDLKHKNTFGGRAVLLKLLKLCISGETGMMRGNGVEEKIQIRQTDGDDSSFKIITPRR